MPLIQLQTKFTKLPTAQLATNELPSELILSNQTPRHQLDSQPRAHSHDDLHLALGDNERQALPSAASDENVVLLVRDPRCIRASLSIPPRHQPTGNRTLEPTSRRINRHKTAANWGNGRLARWQYRASQSPGSSQPLHLSRASLSIPPRHQPTCNPTRDPPVSRAGACASLRDRLRRPTLRFAPAHFVSTTQVDSIVSCWLHDA